MMDLNLNDNGALNDEQIAFVERYYESDTIPILKHPLYVYPFFVPIRGMVAHAMKCIEVRKAAVDDLASQGKWGSYIFRHERPYRLDKLVEVLPLLDDMSPEDYWEIVGNVWDDSESPCSHASNRECWRIIWEQSDVPARQCAADDAELFAELDDEIVIYRGGEHIGMSWTLDLEKAQWFAKRNADFNKEVKTVRRATVSKSDVNWFTSGRGESEIVVADPDCLVNMSVLIPKSGKPSRNMEQVK